MHKKLKKNPGMEQKTCEKGHSPYPHPERGHTKSLDYGSVSKVAQKDARRGPGTLPLPLCYLGRKVLVICLLPAPLPNLNCSCLSVSSLGEVALHTTTSQLGQIHNALEGVHWGLDAIRLPCMFQVEH